MSEPVLRGHRQAQNGSASSLILGFQFPPRRRPMTGSERGDRVTLCRLPGGGSKLTEIRHDEVAVNTTSHDPTDWSGQIELELDVAQLGDQDLGPGEHLAEATDQLTADRGDEDHVGCMPSVSYVAHDVTRAKSVRKRFAYRRLQTHRRDHNYRPVDSDGTLDRGLHLQGAVVGFAHLPNVGPPLPWVSQALPLEVHRVEGRLASRLIPVSHCEAPAERTSENDVLTAVEQFADQVEVSGVHAGLDDDVHQN